MKKQKAFSLLQLLVEVVITLFIAGMVVPNFVRSSLTTREALAGGSLHTINIAGLVFSYTNQNVEFAILGGLVGAMVAFASAFLAATPKNTTTRTITQRAVFLRH